MARDSGLVRKTDAARIGRAVSKIESLTPKNTSMGSHPTYIFMGIPAKITQVFTQGQYALKEQTINDNGIGYTEKKFDARTWDGAENNLPKAFEINGNAALKIGDIAFIRLQVNEESGTSNWVFNGGTATVTGGAGAKNHLDTNKGSHQFVNDVPVGNAALLKDLGPNIYGELNQPLDANWRYIWDSGIPTTGFMIPQPGLDSQGTNVDLGIQNERQIRFEILQGQDGFFQLMIKHSKLPNANFTDEPEMFEHPINHALGTGGYYVIDKKLWDTLPAGTPITKDNLPVKRVRFDVLGHLVDYDGTTSSGEDDPYKETEDPPDDPSGDHGIEVNYVSSSPIPSSGSLWNLAIDQESRLTDGGGGDVVILANNRIEWSIKTAFNTIIGGALTPNDATNATFLGDSTNYNAAQYGNDDQINHDLSRIFNTTFQLMGTDVVEGVNDTSQIIATDTIFANPPEFQSTPDTGMPFVVFCFITEGLVAGGTQYDRWDGFGTYQIDAFLTWESDGTQLENEQLPVVTFDTDKSGAEFTFNVTIEPTRQSDKLCVEFFVNHFNGAPAAAFGNILGAGGNEISATACSAVAGTNTYTAELSLVPVVLDESDVVSVTQGETTMSSMIVPIIVTVKILNGGLPTSDFSTAGNQVTFTVQKATTDIIFSDISVASPTEPDTSDVRTIQAAVVDGSDGFKYFLAAIETSSFEVGQYTVKALVQGIPDTLTATAIFEVVGSDQQDCWSDDFEG